MSSLNPNYPNLIQRLVFCVKSINGLCSVLTDWTVKSPETRESTCSFLTSSSEINNLLLTVCWRITRTVFTQSMLLLHALILSLFASICCLSCFNVSHTAEIYAACCATFIVCLYLFLFCCFK